MLLLGVWCACLPSALCGGDWLHLLVTPGNSGAAWLLALIMLWENLGGKPSTLQETLFLLPITMIIIILRQGLTH